ncbi:MAG: hypothetical protein E4H09_04285, partial [Spirochaetales bacterium]
RIIKNKDERPENEGFQSVVDSVMAVSTGVFVPEQIRWDGLLDSGTLAADGEYLFQVRASDDNGNISVSSAYQVVIDTAPPAVELAFPSAIDRVFSPNGDGNKDSLVLQQSGSDEDLWTAELVNASGRVMRAARWADGSPKPFTWDGRDDSGAMVNDGVFRYRIASTDRAGNSARVELSNIIVNTESTPVALTISVGDFSPNGDGVLDTVTLKPDVPSTTGIEAWSITIRTERGDVVRLYEGDDVPPSEIVFDGRSSSKAVIGEGLYFGELEVVYRNGNRPSAQSALFVVDVTPPLADARLDKDLFSPNNDGKLETVTIFNEASREELWSGKITNSRGVVVRAFTWTGVPEQRLVWNGRRDDGRHAPDGQYFYSLESTDKAGNTGKTGNLPVTIDTSDAEVAIRAEFEAFSPNADNVRDLQRFFPRVDRQGDVAEYRIDIMTESGSVVRSFEGRSAVAGAIEWNGNTSNGRRVGDGIYKAVFAISFTNGVALTAQTAGFSVDTIPPTATLNAPYLLFSPDGDGNRDILRIQQTTSLEERWQATMRNSLGQVVRQFIWTGMATGIEWDGTDTAGNALPDGRFQYEITATDRAGNTTVRGLTDITTDTRTPRLFVTANTDAFSPNGAGVRDAVTFDLYANLLDCASGWTLTVRSADGVVVREFSGTTVEAQRTIVWDGRDGRGAVREGSFTAELAINYTKGNRPRAVSSAITVDITPPVA